MIEGPLRLSNSEMSRWRRCRRQWYLGHYRRLKSRSEKVTGTMSIGNRVHDALAIYYDPTYPNADPVLFIRAEIKRDLDKFPTQEDDLLKEQDLCCIMVEGYLEWLAEEGADQDLIIEGSESKVEVKLADGINLVSKLDAPVSRISDEARLALEHKTVGSLDQLMPTLKIDTQFLTEHLARFLLSQEQGATPGEAIQQCEGVLLNMLKKVKRTAAAKPPFYGRETVPHNIEELRNHFRHCVAIGREILDAHQRLDAGESHHTVCPPSPTRDDFWDNSFYKVFAMMDDGSDWEGALEALYVEYDPLERYLGATELL